MQEEIDFVKWFATEFGLLFSVLIAFNIFTSWQWWLERKDRRAAWKAHNEFKQEVVDTLKDVMPLITLIKDRLDRK